MPSYLTTKIVEAKTVETRPGAGMTVAGYTKRAGAPTSVMVRLDGENRWRRVYCWQFSNAGTLFIRYRGESLIVNEYDIPARQ